MTIQSTRATTIKILCQWQKSRANIDPTCLYHTGTMSEARDRQLVKAMVFGVLRNLNYLDFILQKFCRQPLDKMPDIALQSLRSAVYQLLFMDRIPESAAINETIKALKAEHQPKWLTGFVNGVLRNICRNKNKLAGIDDPTLPLTVQCNHPDWLVRRWQDRFGRQKTVDICRGNNKPAPLCLRINPHKISRLDFIKELERHDYKVKTGITPEAVWLDNAGVITKIPGFNDGLFFVQDETAQLISGLLAPFARGNYLDACAGLGGKTMALAQMIPAGSKIWAVEPQKARQGLLRDNLSRLDLENNAATTIPCDCFDGDLAEFSRVIDEKFQAILVDAPCSGLGVCGRHPDIRWNRKPADLLRFQKKQLNLLHTAAEMLSANGILVYSTCSTEPEENEEVVAAFLAEHPDFLLSDAGKYLPEQALHLLDEQRCLHTRPSASHGNQDGFFAARFMRDG